MRESRGGVVFRARAIGGSARRLRACAALALGLASLSFAQARGVIIPVPEDDLPTGSRPAPAAPPPAPVPPPAMTPPPPAPAGPPPDRAAAGGAGVCPGPGCRAGAVWHVVKASRGGCLDFGVGDLRGEDGVARLRQLMPAPAFIVAQGACPR